MKDLKKYNKIIYSFLLIFLSITILLFLFNSISLNKAKFYYLTSDLTIKSESQILPYKYSEIQLLRHYFSGPINVKKFKKDLFQQIEIKNVYFIDYICKIVLSDESSLIFNNYPENIKEKISEATFLTLKKNRIFKNIKKIEFFIFDKIKTYSYPSD